MDDGGAGNEVVDDVFVRCKAKLQALTLLLAPRRHSTSPPLCGFNLI